MFPTKAAGYLRFEFHILGRVPLVEHGVFDKRLVEPECEVAQNGYFIFGVGVVEANGAAITGQGEYDGHEGSDGQGHRNGREAGSVRHKEVRLKFFDKTTLRYKKAIRNTLCYLGGKRQKREISVRNYGGCVERIR